MASGAIPLHATQKSLDSDHSDDRNPLPQLLQTPSGLALLELQGTINLPLQEEKDIMDTVELHSKLETRETPIGRLVFPLYDAKEKDGGVGWMKKVHLYVGKHQRLTGEVKKLPKAIAVIRRRGSEQLEMNQDEQMHVDDDHRHPAEGREELEIVEIVKYKILFSSRPEPVGTWAAAS